MNEEWRPVPAFEAWYEVSSLGRVRRIKQACGTTIGKVLRPGRNRLGYPYVVLSREGRVTTHTVHKFVAGAFLGPRPDGLDVNHIDGDKANNRAENLEYCTRAANLSHAYRVGLRRYDGTKPRNALGQYVVEV